MTTYVYGQVDPNPNPTVGKGGYGGDPDHDLHDEAHARRQPTTSTCRDAIWAILFIIHLAVVMGFGFHYFYRYRDEMWSSARTNLEDRNITTHGTSLVVILFLLGMSMSMFWLWLAKSQARLLIQISLYFSIAMNILVLIWFIYLRAMAGIIIMAIALVFNVLWVWAVQSRIPFATAMLDISITAIKLYPAQIYTAVLFLVMQILWIITWVISFSSIMWVLNDKQNKPTNQQNGFTVFALLISLYWTAQVIKNVNHTMVAGVVGNWYFFYPTSMPRNPTLHAFRRATTTSLGSICLGSLIVAIVQAICALLQSMANRDRDNAAGACLACIADCILGCIESIITYINKYAFTHVGLYGKPYCQAAHDAFELLTRRGLDAVVNDSLINGVLWMGCVITGLICALIMTILTRTVWIENYWWAWAIAGFLTGFILCACTMDIVESAVTTIFVCLAEDPNALADTKPELYERLVPALEEVYPDVNLRPLVGGHHA